MRRGSLIGPLVLIGIGVLFLLRNVWPQIPVLDFLSRYWPLLLIGWGSIRLIEILVWAKHAKPLPRNGISGGEWLLVVLICVLGASLYAAHRYANWFPVWRGVVMDFGASYEYPLQSVEKPCAKNCRVVIENFRGNARISGSDETVVRAAGRETIRSFQQPDADRASKQTPLELIQQGNQIIVQTNQDRAPGPARVSCTLEITVPSDSSIQAQGQFGDLQIQNVKGSVDLKGRGQGLDLENIAGPVNVEGAYSGQIQLRNLSQPLRFQDPRMTLRFGSLPGQARVETGGFTANNVTGPVLVNGRSQDVRISGFTESLELTLNRGDIDLRPGKTVPRMDVHTRSGDIDLWLPAEAKFDLRASTERGEAHNDYGEPLAANASNRGATITGRVPGGPQLRLETGRGSVTVRKSTSDETAFPDTLRLPTSSDQPLHVERQ